MMSLSLDHGKKYKVSSVISVDSKERSDWAREKSLKCLISHRARRVRRERREISVSSIMRPPDPAHTPCPCQGRSKISPAGACGFAGMNPSPIPAKEKSSSVPSVVSKERKRLGERKKP